VKGLFLFGSVSIKLKEIKQIIEDLLKNSELEISIKHEFLVEKVKYLCDFSPQLR